MVEVTDWDPEEANTGIGAAGIGAAVQAAVEGGVLCLCCVHPLMPIAHSCDPWPPVPWGIRSITISGVATLCP